MSPADWLLEINLSPTIVSLLPLIAQEWFHVWCSNTDNLSACKLPHREDKHHDTARVAKKDTMAPERAEKIAKKALPPMNKFIYDFFLWIFSIVVDLFFREVHPRSSWKIPRKGPVIFVAAPHANQVQLFEKCSLEEGLTCA